MDLDAADTGGTSSMSNFRNASTMSSPLDGYVSATYPHFALLLLYVELDSVTVIPAVNLLL